MSSANTAPNHPELRSANADKRSIEQRLEAFKDRQPDTTPRLVIDAGAAASAQSLAIPEIDADQLNAETLRSALLECGSLIVRGLFEPDAIASLTPAIDRVLQCCIDHKQGLPTDDPIYFNPPDNLVDILPNKDRELGNTRSFHRESGSAMCVEAPSIAESLLELYATRGLRSMLAHYFDQPVCLSAKKWVLRRSRLPVAEAGWHQDGAFMGTDINSVNLWLPLNACGGETGSPGLDVLPRRLTEIASAKGAQFDWSVSTAEVTRDAGMDAISSPAFSAGDAYFFDHFLLHRTQCRADFHMPRYAIETWFFGANSFPKNQVPLAW